MCYELNWDDIIKTIADDNHVALLNVLQSVVGEDWQRNVSIVIGQTITPRLTPCELCRMLIEQTIHSDAVECFGELIDVLDGVDMDYHDSMSGIMVNAVKNGRGGRIIEELWPMIVEYIGDDSPIDENEYFFEAICVAAGKNWNDVLVNRLVAFGGGAGVLGGAIRSCRINEIELLVNAYGVKINELHVVDAITTKNINILDMVHGLMEDDVGWDWKYHFDMALGDDGVELQVLVEWAEKMGCHRYVTEVARGGDLAETQRIIAQIYPSSPREE